MTVIELQAFTAISELPSTLEDLKTPDLLLLSGMAMQGILARMDTPLVLSKDPSRLRLLVDSSLACGEALLNAYREKTK